MNGCEIRLGKLFNEEENAVVVAMDHGMFDGPHAGMENIPQTLTHLGDAADAILLSPGVFRQCADYFGRRNAPLGIIRINFNSVFCFKWDYRQAVCAPSYSPRDAQALGADIVLICLTLRTGSEERDARNAELFAKLCREAHACGLPVVGEYFPHSHLEKSPPDFAQEIEIGCRMLQELGADCIKTFHTQDFARLTSCIGIPILGLGAEKTPTDLAALVLAEKEAKEGARGVVFGRNAVQASNPSKFIEALCDVVKRGMPAEEAAVKYGLTQ